MKNEKTFHEKLHTTAQPYIFYTDIDNLPESVSKKLMESDIELFDELSGGGSKLQLYNVEIEGVKYNIEYTIDYIQDYSLAFENNNDEEIETEMMARANEFLSSGFFNDVYLEYS